MKTTTMKDLSMKKVTELRELCKALKNDLQLTVGVSKFTKEECLAFIKENYVGDMIIEEEKSPFTGRYVDAEFTNKYLENECRSKMSDDDIERARKKMITDAQLLGITPDLNNWRAIMDTHQELMEWRKAPKRSQWECIQLNVASVDCDLQFDSSKVISIKYFDSKKEASQAQAIVSVPVSVTRAKKVADELGKELLIFKAVPFIEMDEGPLKRMLESIYRSGITDVATGKHYLPATQSASQARQGALWFLEANDFDEVDEFRLRCMRLTKEQYESIFGNLVQMAKLEARVGLAVSNTLDMRDVCVECRDNEFINVVNNLKVSVVEDVTLNIKKDVIIPDITMPGVTNLVKDKEIELNASDGCGLMSVTTTVKLNYALHLISHKDYERFFIEWDNVGRDLQSVEEKSWLRTFVLRLSKVFQIRHAGDKGIIVMANMEAYDIEEDILLHDSVRKYDFGDWSDAPLEICMYDKPKKGIANLNFQFIQALNIKPEDLIELAKEPLSYITDKVLTDYPTTMKFLGMIERIGQDDEESASVDTKLNKVLETDPIMLSDPQIQKWLLEKVDKFVTDVGIGKIPMEGAYYYIVTDPRYLLSRHLGFDIKHLQAGEYYLNGKTGTCAGFRSPLIHSSEAQRFDCVADENLWYYTDLMIFNPYDGAAPAMGGASL